MEENTFKIIIIVLMLITLSSTITIFAYQQGTSKTSSPPIAEAVYLGSAILHVNPNMSGISLNLTIKLYNPLNETVRVFYKIHANPPELVQYVSINSKDSTLQPQSKKNDYVTITIHSCPYTGKIFIMAFGK